MSDRLFERRSTGLAPPTTQSDPFSGTDWMAGGPGSLRLARLTWLDPVAGFVLAALASTRGAKRGIGRFVPGFGRIEVRETEGSL